MNRNVAQSTEKLFATLFGLSLVALGAVGCGEEPEVVELEEAAEREALSSTTSAIVTPQFRLSGLDDIPQGLSLQELGLSISEIRLEPLNGSDGLAYATTQPFELAFDLSQGQYAMERQSVVLPQTGRFLVSVRLEPDGQGLDENDQVGSLNLRGRVRSELLDEQESDQDDSDSGLNPTGAGELEGRENDGSPLPLPLDEHRFGEFSQWTTFAFRSDRTVFYTFSDVYLEPGEQILTFDFDLRDWAASALLPLVDAAELDDTQEEVDVSQDFDSPDSGGPESLLNAGSVSTQASQQ